MAEWIVRENDSAALMLTEQEAENNCLCVADYLIPIGWSINAVSSVCGNMWIESHINPGQWELGQAENFSRGYGLGQWTPAQKLVTWANENNLPWRGNGQSQLKFLNETPGQWNKSYDPGAPSIEPPLTFEEFKLSALPVQTLSDYWLYYWEQPSYSQSAESKDSRREHSEKYYTLISGHTPEPPKPEHNGISIYFWAKNIF